jgi:hypothetical protein
VVAGVVTACAAADDLFRAASGRSDDIARAVTASSDEALEGAALGDEIATILRQARVNAASRAAARLDDLARTYTSSETAESALASLSWDVTCDVIAGNIPKAAPDITRWLVQRATSFGLEFVGDGASAVADALFSSIDSESEHADAAQACSQLSRSGL